MPDLRCKLCENCILRKFWTLWYSLFYLVLNTAYIVCIRLYRICTCSVRMALKDFCVQFLECCYNPIMRVVKDNIQHQRAMENDDTYYLWAVRCVDMYIRIYVHMCMCVQYVRMFVYISLCNILSATFLLFDFFQVLHELQST